MVPPIDIFESDNPYLPPQSAVGSHLQYYSPDLTQSEIALERVGLRRNSQRTFINTVMLATELGCATALAYYSLGSKIPQLQTGSVLNYVALTAVPLTIVYMAAREIKFARMAAELDRVEAMRGRDK